MKFSVNLPSRRLVDFLGATIKIRVTRPFIVSFIPSDQYGGPYGFYNHAYMYCLTKFNQKRHIYSKLERK